MFAQSKAKEGSDVQKIMKTLRKRMQSEGGFTLRKLAGKRAACAVIALGMGLSLSSCSKKETADVEGTTKLVITAIPDEKISDQEAKFQALGEYLHEKLDIPVEFSISKDYSTSVQRFANGEVHLVWFGGLTGVQARALVPGSRAIAQGVEDPHFKSYFIANVDTGLKPSVEFPMAIKDMSFTFGAANSTSGSLMPTFFIKEETGKYPKDFFSQPVQFQEAGGHVATAKAVESGSVQTGVLNYATYDTMVKDGELDPEKAVIIWTTPEYADYNLTVHPILDKSFGEGFIDKLQKALVECEKPEVLKAFNRETLIPAKNEDFEGIEKVARDLDKLR